MDNMRIVLCDEENSHLRVNVDAEVSDGCLRISGQDLGETVEAITGEDEYEYFYDFDRKNTERLFALLGPETDSVKDVFAKKFSGIDGCRVIEVALYHPNRQHPYTFSQRQTFSGQANQRTCTDLLCFVG